MTFIRPRAEKVEYDDSSSGINADNVQDAIDTLDGYIDSQKKTEAVEFTLTSDVLVADRYFTVARSSGGDFDNTKYSSHITAFQNPNQCSPYQVPFDATIVEILFSVRGLGVQNASASFPVNYRCDLIRVFGNTETDIAQIDIQIPMGTTVGTFGLLDSDLSTVQSVSVDVDKGDLIGLEFRGQGLNNIADRIAYSRNAFVTFVLEER